MQNARQPRDAGRSALTDDGQACSRRCESTGRKDMKTHQSLIALALLIGATTAAAQTFPTKPLRLVVAAAPGGTPDILARIVGPKLSEQVGQPVIVDNRPGATGNIGAEVVAKAPRDGYTL